MGNEGGSSGVSTFIAFLTGALAGAAIGLLLAPAAGHETRKRIRDTSLKAKEGVEDAAQKAIELTTVSVHKYLDRGMEQIHDTAQNLKAAVEAGRNAYMDKKEEIDNHLSQNAEETEPKDNEDAV